MDYVYVSEDEGKVTARTMGCCAEYVELDKDDVINHIAQLERELYEANLILKRCF